MRPAPHLVAGRDESKTNNSTWMDSNTALEWIDSELYAWFSAGQSDAPIRLHGASISELGDPQPIRITNARTSWGKYWVEGTFMRGAALYALYHHERYGRCGSEEPASVLASPIIGLMRSYDRGLTFEDLGTLIESPEGSDNCEAKNGYFVGGVGDPSVLVEANNPDMIYVFYTKYWGAPETHGPAVAFTYGPWLDDNNLAAFNYDGDDWNEPAVGGAAQVLFPATRGFDVLDVDAYWGPSVHYNTELKTYVMLLNRIGGATEDSRWRQEGVYVSFFTSPLNFAAMSWTAPQKILAPPGADAWYPIFVGSAPYSTQKLGNGDGRLFLRADTGDEQFHRLISRWELRFSRALALN